MRYLRKDIKDITVTHIDSIAGIIKNGGHSDINGGIKADVSCGVLKIYIKTESTESGFTYKLEIDKTVFLKENELFIKISQKKPENDEKYKYVYTKVFDYDKISGNIVIRSRKNGDRLATGKNGKTTKLKDIFIDKKIPNFDRDKIPVLSCENGIISVLGLKDSSFFAPDANTENYLYIYVWRKQDD